MNAFFSYESACGIAFRTSLEDAVRAIPGNTRVIHKRGGSQIWAGEFCFLFDRLGMRECVSSYPADTVLNGVLVDWSSIGLRNLILADPEPLYAAGTIVLFSIGISVSGWDIGEEPDRSICLFDSGVWDNDSDLVPLSSLKRHPTSGKIWLPD